MRGFLEICVLFVWRIGILVKIGLYYCYHWRLFGRLSPWKDSGSRTPDRSPRHPSSLACCRWLSLYLRYRILQWLWGLTIFSRPSIHSGNFITSSISMASIPFSFKILQVPPVLIISQPSSYNLWQTPPSSFVTDTDQCVHRLFLNMKFFVIICFRGL